MSRIGKKFIPLSAAVTVTVDGREVSIKGPKGTLVRTLPAVISVDEVALEQGGKALRVTAQDPKADSVIWGTTRAHLANMVVGVEKGWAKSLELNGVGFRMAVTGKKLKMNLGFSHEVVYILPEGITATIAANVVTIAGIDRELVGRVASELRSLKKPEPYKGKGFKYTTETIRRKVGKAAKTE
ncbi:MAG: 50S ribosomal protein L6 [Patescibacteria group bacterium]|jgi:large subunit ribosomal protein L6